MGSNIDVASTGQLVNRLMNPPDMGAQFAKGLDTLNAWKNFQAQQASADAYKQSVDPVTGEVDLGKYKSLLSQGPGAWAFGPLVTSGGQAVGAVGQGTTADINAKMRQIDATGQMMYLLLRDGYPTQSIDPARVQAQLDQAHATRLITDQQYNAWSGQIKGMTPQQAYGFVLGANEGNEGARAFLQPNMFSYGSGAVNINPASPGGRVPAGGVVPFSPSPGEQISQQQWLKTPYSWYDPTSMQYTQGTYQQFLDARGANPNLIWQGPPPPAGGAPGGGALPAQGAPSPAAPAPSPASAPAPAPSGGRGAPSAAPPAAAPASAPSTPPAASGAPAAGAAGKPAVLPPPETIKANVDAYNAAQAEQPNHQARITTANLALQSLSGAEVGGKGTEALQALNNALGTWSPEFIRKIIPDYDPEKAASDYQTAAKYMQQITNASIPGGQGTNEKLAAAATATPNVHMQDMAARQVLQTMISGEQMQQYVFDQFQKTGQAPAQYAKFAANWAQTHDPRAFMLGHTTPEQLQYLQKTMPPGSPARKTFNSTVHELVQNGVIPDPTKPPGQD